MSAITAKQQADMMNDAADRTAKAGVIAHGENEAARLERVKLTKTQIHTARQTEMMKHMWESTTAIGAIQAGGASSGAKRLNAEATERAKWDFQGTTTHQNISNQLINFQMGIGGERLQSNQRLKQTLMDAQAMRRDAGMATLAGAFQDLGMVIGMGSGIHGMTK